MEKQINFSSGSFLLRCFATFLWHTYRGLTLRPVFAGVAATPVYVICFTLPFFFATWFRLYVEGNDLFFILSLDILQIVIVLLFFLKKIPFACYIFGIFTFTEICYGWLLMVDILVKTPVASALYVGISVLYSSILLIKYEKQMG